MKRVFTNLSTGIRNKRSPWLWLWLSSLAWLLPNTVMTNSTLAAEKIYISYGAFESSISVASLDTYAKTGILDEDLANYAKYISPQQLKQLQRVLSTPIPLSSVAVSQFLYSPIGATLLERLGEIIQTEARQPGFYALRAALILAATEAEGLTLLNVLEKFPTRSLRIDLGRSLQLADRLDTLIHQSRAAIALVSRQSTTAAQGQRIDFSKLPDLRSHGRFGWHKQTLKLSDNRRKRTFFADLYLPETGDRRGAEKTRGQGGEGGELPITNPKSKIQNSFSPRFPVVVISHGLGSDRTSFTYLAQQLASYGFAVAVPEHPESSAEQLRALFSGEVAEVAEPNEFIHRPLDIKYLLNELQRMNAADPRWQLDLQQVGAIGQSLGGYTALALAGAKLQFDRLRTNCKNREDLWNVSLLLQCRVLELPAKQYYLQDSRIKAAIAINPITSSVFGQAGMSQISVPVTIVASGADTIAPALLEQIIPFSWLTTPRKYLAAIKRATHFSTIGETPPDREATISLPSRAIGSNPAIARLYISALSVAFFETYLAKNPQYRPYLSSAYVEAISQKPLEISLIQSLAIAQLTDAICAGTALKTSLCPPRQKSK